KPRVQQVQNRVSDSSSVLGNGKPVADFFSTVRRLVVVGIAVTIEIPGRTDERVHGVGLAARRPATFRAGGVYKFRRRRQRRFAFAGELGIWRQQHRQILVGDGYHAVFGAVNDRDRKSVV